jgi:coenzyme F420-reducing hydrogenase gamma subunit
MKSKINSQIKLFKQSIDWWREESLKTSLEVEELQVLFESGAISEEEVVEQVRDLNNKMDYLHRKGHFEQRNLFDSFVSTVK